MFFSVANGVAVMLDGFFVCASFSKFGRPAPRPPAVGPAEAGAAPSMSLSLKLGFRRPAMPPGPRSGGAAGALRTELRAGAPAGAGPRLAIAAILACKDGGMGVAPLGRPARSGFEARTPLRGGIASGPGRAVGDVEADGSAIEIVVSGWMRRKEGRRGEASGGDDGGGRGECEWKGITGRAV